MSGWMKTSRIGGTASATVVEHRRALAHPPVPVGEEARERQDDQQLPELGRLEAEEADVDPAARAARDLAGEEHDA